MQNTIQAGGQTVLDKNAFWQEESREDRKYSIRFGQQVGRQV
jgi:hypothetical protein